MRRPLGAPVPGLPLLCPPPPQGTPPATLRPRPLLAGHPHSPLPLPPSPHRDSALFCSKHPCFLKYFPREEASGRVSAIASRFKRGSVLVPVAESEAETRSSRPRPLILPWFPGAWETVRGLRPPGLPLPCAFTPVTATVAVMMTANSGSPAPVLTHVTCHHHSRPPRPQRGQATCSKSHVVHTPWDFRFPQPSGLRPSHLPFPPVLLLRLNLTGHTHRQLHLPAGSLRGHRAATNGV